jgi:hypothetical protein
MSDLWSSEEREIVPGLKVGFAYADAAVAEGFACKIGTTAANRFAVTTAAGIADGLYVALKAIAATGYGPVALSGIVKMVTCNSANIAQGALVQNSAEAGISGIGTDVLTMMSLWALFGGSSHILGQALQAATNQGDEILVAIGRVN